MSIENMTENYKEILDQVCAVDDREIKISTFMAISKLMAQIAEFSRKVEQIESHASNILTQLEMRSNKKESYDY